MSIPTAAAPSRSALAFALTDARGQVLAAQEPERPFYAASTIKLHVLLAALRAGERRDLDLAATVPATRTFVGVDGRPFTLGGDHLDPTHPDDGVPVPVRELLTRMIDRSSNEATDHVIELIGLEAVAEAIADLGLASTRVERLIGDAAALEQGLTNETSAADLVRTVRALTAPAPAPAPEPADGAAADGPRAGARAGLAGLSAGLSAPSRALARTALAAQQIRIIAAALRPDVPVGSKSGWVDGYRHDVAVIGDPGSEQVRHLAVMTAGMGEAEADAAIQDRVRRLLPHLAR